MRNLTMIAALAIAMSFGCSTKTRTVTVTKTETAVVTSEVGLGDPKFERATGRSPTTGYIAAASPETLAIVIEASTGTAGEDVLIERIEVMVADTMPDADWANGSPATVQVVPSDVAHLATAVSTGYVSYGFIGGDYGYGTVFDVQSRAPLYRVPENGSPLLINVRIDTRTLVQGEGVIVSALLHWRGITSNRSGTSALVVGEPQFAGPVMNGDIEISVHGTTPTELFSGSSGTIIRIDVRGVGGDAVFNAGFDGLHVALQDSKGALIPGAAPLLTWDAITGKYQDGYVFAISTAYRRLYPGMQQGALLTCTEYMRVTEQDPITLDIVLDMSSLTLASRDELYVYVSCFRRTRPHDPGYVEVCGNSVRSTLTVP